MFNQRHISQLVPVILKIKNNHRFSECGFAEYSDNEIRSSLFPELITGKWREHENVRFIQLKFPQIHVSYNGSNSAGGYYRVVHDEMGCIPKIKFHRFECQTLSSWSIYRPNDTKNGGNLCSDWELARFLDAHDGDDEEDAWISLWICPGSANEILPPTSGWVRCDESKQGENDSFKIEYIYKENKVQGAHST